jgi:hypothetical protein
MPEFPVQLHHPETGGQTTAPTKSSLRVLEARGWQRVTGESADQLRRVELEAIARERGIDPAAYRTKADLAAALDGTAS